MIKVPLEVMCNRIPSFPLKCKETAAALQPGTEFCEVWSTVPCKALVLSTRADKSIDIR